MSGRKWNELRKEFIVRGVEWPEDVEKQARKEAKIMKMKEKPLREALAKRHQEKEKRF